MNAHVLIACSENKLREHCSLNFYLHTFIFNRSIFLKEAAFFLEMMKNSWIWVNELDFL